MDKLNEHYRDYSEDSRLVKDNAHRTEFLTTVNLLQDFAVPGKNILDVGAGTGRYSFYFAEKGCDVTALEYTESNLATMQQKLDERDIKPKIRLVRGDGRDLSGFGADSFDLVLCMGPIYHLDNDKDRKQCLGECLRVLKNGGILVVSYLNKFASYMEYVKRDKTILMDKLPGNILSHGYMYGDERDIFYFTTPKDIEELLETFNTEIITNAATDGIGYLLKDMVNNLDKEEYESWLQYHIKICREPSILGYSMHGLLICRKRGGL